MNEKSSFRLSKVLQNQQQSQQEQHGSDTQLPQLILEQTKNQHYYLKVTLSVFLIALSTYSSLIQIQYHGPFMRTIQCFFNYHLLEHESQDIYQGGDVIFYRTQQYNILEDIKGFYKRYEKTIEKFYGDSFFYINQKAYDKQKKNDHKFQLKKDIIKFSNEYIINNSNRDTIIIMAIFQIDVDSSDLIQQKFSNLLQYRINKYQVPLKISPKSIKSSKQAYQIFSVPITLLEEFFQGSLYNKTFYDYIRKVEFLSYSEIKYRAQFVELEIKVSSVFLSAMMMSSHIQTNVYNLQTEQVIRKSSEQQFDENKLGVRKRPEHHFLGTNFEPIRWIIVIFNAILFCIELMVVIRTNKKINETLNQSTDHHQLQDNQSFRRNSNSLQNYSFFDGEDISKPKQTLSYQQRIDIIGRYSMVELLISFIVLFTFQSRGLTCLLIWAKLSIIMSASGNKLMLGFLFKHSFPALMRVVIYLLIPLSGFVFFSMLVYQSTKKFESIKLGYYEYLFNYFQYGIYQNFIPIQKYGSLYTITYFLQLVFLVSVGNNILMSILAQQVLKNSNLKDLTELIQQIEVQCPVCGCPPEVKKKINIKMKDENNRQSRFISKYFSRNLKQSSNKSKYEIKIASPQFSPMFHKSQLNKKQLFLKKKQYHLADRKFSQDQSFEITPKLSPKTLAKKKVKIEIGSQIEINTKYMTKQSLLITQIKSKTDILNKILQDFTRKFLISTPSQNNRQFYLQILQKKLEQIKKLQAMVMSKIQAQ